MFRHNSGDTVLSEVFGKFQYPTAPLSDGAEDVDAVTLRAALADIEQPLSGTVLADRIHLVEQWHDGAHIMWDPIAEVLLAGRPAD